jgi:hypothetical protein
VDTDFLSALTPVLKVLLSYPGTCLLNLLNARIIQALSNLSMNTAFIRK